MRARTDPFFSPYTGSWYAGHADAEHFDQTMCVGHAVARYVLPSSAIDIGCGLGTMLWGVYVETHGGCTCFGVEADHAAKLREFRENLAVPADWVVFTDLRRFLLRQATHEDQRLFDRYDLAICCEVGEHLPTELSALLVEYLCRRAPTVAWSAAFPGQGGEGHINEQQPEFWRKLFEDHGFRLDVSGTETIIGDFTEVVTRVPWYRNLKLYRSVR